MGEPKGIIDRVKDALGIHPADPNVVVKPKYSDTAPEITAEEAMRLDPDAYTKNGVEQANARARLEDGM
jgi:hypothetical protein